MCYVFKEIFSSKRLNNEHFSAQHTEPLKCSKCPFLEFKTKNDKKVSQTQLMEMNAV